MDRSSRGGGGGGGGGEFMLTIYRLVYNTGWMNLTYVSLGYKQLIQTVHGSYIQHCTFEAKVQCLLSLARSPSTGLVFPHNV